MKSFRKNARAVLLVMLALFVALSAYFVYAIKTYGGRWLTNPYNVRLQNQKSAVVPGDILDRTGKTLATTDGDGVRVYTADKSARRALAHVIGDNYGLTGTGAENMFANYLLGLDAGLLERLGYVFSGEKQRGSDVTLTVDAELCEYAAGLLGDYSGAIVVMNYKTGELLCSTSAPTFDLNKAQAYLEEGAVDDGALVNRVTSGRYTPGSVFKIVTAAAAIRFIPNALDEAIQCGGPLAFDKETGRFLPNVLTTPEEDERIKNDEENEPEYNYVRDYQLSYHDTLTLKQAFAKSCNVSFARLGLTLGADRLNNMARELGIGVDFSFRDVSLYAGSYERGSTEYETAWSAVGQHKDLVTPMNLVMISAAIANDGVMMEPKLLKSVTNSANRITESATPTAYSQPLSTSEAQAMQELMTAVVESGTGTNAAISGYTVGGKTGTAQVGSNVEDHAWFTGFVKSDDHPLAIAVVVEHGGSGGRTAAPIAQKVLKKAIALGW